MPVVAHPGPSSPVAPGIRLEVPQEWATAPAGTALLRAGGPGRGGDEVDVVVVHRVGAPGETAEAVAAEAAASAAGASGEVEEPFVVEICGREWFAHNVSLDTADGPVVEVHLVTALPATEEASPVVHVLGRVRGDGLDADYDLLQQVLETLSVEEAGA
ncbi:MAG: hypothetical protein IE926_09630 [Micrococcales bacterium]|uniref:hypothetical protein n=1 Tax=Phycicoccus sp. TaxID=1902410 RepID=UPI0019C38DBC|nr:hypothetical protein [Phycicoccus sp.]MBD3783199.1 hypothetical protein [Micrococcales bacterium]HMM94884.1 hypothetical protein [Phycicoccus sp.]